MLIALTLLACGPTKSYDSAGSGVPGGCMEGYADLDGDSYAGTLEFNCTGGLSKDQDDCDDGDPATNPGASESCETSGDDDCDGVANEADALGCTDWYADRDDDGYGSSDRQCRCESEAPYTSSTPGDCDDSDAGVVPQSGLCGLMGDAALTDATATLSGPDADHARAGWNVAMAGDVDGDGLGDLVVSSPDGTGWAESAGAVWVVTGVPSGASSLDDATATIEGEADWWFGWSVAGPGDLDGDGYADVLAGACGDDVDLGAAWILPGPLEGASSPRDVGIRLDGTDGIAALDMSGGRLASGASAVWISDVYDADSGVGGAWLVPGDTGADATLGAVAHAVVTYIGPPSVHHAGMDGTGDADGDGMNDLVLGSPGVMLDGVASVGAAYVLLGPFADVLSVDDADLTVQGQDSASVGTGGVGCSASFTGDSDGDGLSDLMVGAPDLDEHRGRAAWFAATRRGEVSFDDADASIAGRGSTPDDDCCAGAVVAGVGDQDQDGLDDVAVPISGDFAVYVFAGPLEGSLTGANAVGRLRYNPNGVANLTGAASSIAADDLNDDGWPDVLLGSMADEHTYEQQGTAYLFMGGGV